MKIRTTVLIVTFATTVLADPPIPAVESVPPGDDHIVVVREGDRAPFTGQLFDSATALRWANWLQQYRQLLITTVEHDQQVCRIRLDYDATVLKNEQARTTALALDLNRRLAGSEKARVQAEYEAQNPPWYRTVWFGTGIGIVTTVAISAVVVKTTAK